MDVDALNASGITRLHNHPYLNLQGEGTVIAVIDSGIDYMNPIFRSGDVSRIAYIWDQTIPAFAMMFPDSTKNGIARSRNLLIPEYMLVATIVRDVPE